MRYVAALAATLAVEALVVAFLTRGRVRNRVVATSLALNLVTHPLAWLLVRDVRLPFLLVEAAVIAAEAQLYRVIERPPLLRAWLWSLAANGVTIALSYAW